MFVRPDHEAASDEITRARSLPPGDPAAPMLFNVIPDTLAEELIATAVSRGWGLRLGDNSWVNLLLFADSRRFHQVRGPLASLSFCGGIQRGV